MSINKISQTGVGSSSVFPVDLLQKRFALTLQTMVTGTATYSIEVTIDDVFDEDFDASTADWFSLGATLTNVSTNAIANLAQIISGLRLKITSGTGTVSLTILQAGVG